MKHTIASTGIKMNDNKHSIKELIELAKNRTVTDADIKQFEERLKARQKEFQDMEDSHKITNEFLNREYLI